MFEFENELKTQINRTIKLYKQINLFLKNDKHKEKQKNSLIKNMQKNTIINLYNVICTDTL